MIRKILSLPTLALCFTLCTALFAGCGENNVGFVTECVGPMSRTPNMVNTSTSGSKLREKLSPPWVIIRGFPSAVVFSTLDTFTRHDIPEVDKDTAYYKDIVIYLTRNERKGTATLKLVAPPNRTQQPKQFKI